MKMNQIIIDYKNYQIKIFEHKKLRRITVICDGKENEYDFLSFRKYLGFEQLLYPKIQKDSLSDFDNQIIVKSEMAGLITLVSVKKNQEIKKDDLILAISAMKIENEIFSPINGVVKNIFVKEGQNIALNSKLVEIISENL